MAEFEEDQIVDGLKIVSQKGEIVNQWVVVAITQAEFDEVKANFLSRLLGYTLPPEKTALQRDISWVASTDQVYRVEDKFLPIDVIMHALDKARLSGLSDFERGKIHKSREKVTLLGSRGRIRIVLTGGS